MTKRKRIRRKQIPLPPWGQKATHIRKAVERYLAQRALLVDPRSGSLRRGVLLVALLPGRTHSAKSVKAKKGESNEPVGGRAKCDRDMLSSADLRPSGCVSR